MTPEEEQNLIEMGMQHCMSNRQGRAFIQSILQKSGLHAKIFENDALLTAYNCGAREKVGVWLERELIRVVPGSYATLQEESRHG